MGDLIALDHAKHRVNPRAQELWEAYRRAAAKAQETRNIDDGIAAGLAWAEWVEFFLGGDK